MANAPTAAESDYRSCRSNQRKVYRWKLARKGNQRRGRHVQDLSKITAFAGGRTGITQTVYLLAGWGRDC